MNKIQRTSRYLRWLFSALMVLTPIFYIAFWFFIPDLIKHDNFVMYFDVIPKDLNVEHPLNNITRLLGLTINLIPLTVTMLLYSNLVMLFMMYERLNFFNMQNVAVIRRIGIYLLLSEIIRPFIEATISALLTWQNTPGKRTVAISLEGNNFGLIITGIMIILISWIIAEGHRLSEEQGLTI
jgi:hypothetical protein